jgi:hypothetical protein
MGAGVLKPQALALGERENLPNVPLKIILNQTRYWQTSRGSFARHNRNAVIQPGSPLPSSAGLTRLTAKPMMNVCAFVAAPALSTA